LDAKAAEIHVVAQTLQGQLDTLVAYRKSLIHECVTGQRRVTEDDLKRVQAHG
jgi:type I restriction enzyme S subunit